MARVAVVSGTATAVSNRVSRRQGRRWGEEDQQAQPEQYAPQQPEPPEDPIAKLKELGELRDSGVLTEEEFTAQKTLLLNNR
jgi:hypothetical protein